MKQIENQANTIDFNTLKIRGIRALEKIVPY